MHAQNNHTIPQITTPRAGSVAKVVYNIVNNFKRAQHCLCKFAYICILGTVEQMLMVI